MNTGKIGCKPENSLAFDQTRKRDKSDNSSGANLSTHYGYEWLHNAIMAARNKSLKCYENTKQVTPKKESGTLSENRQFRLDRRDDEEHAPSQTVFLTIFMKDAVNVLS